MIWLDTSALPVNTPPTNRNTTEVVADGTLDHGLDHSPFGNSAGDRQAGTAWRTSHPDEAPPTVFLFLAILVMLLLYAAMFLLVLCFVFWQLWITTRTMFVFPLIADRNIGFREALRQSWSETRVRFWELLAINFSANVITMIGMNFLYVGVIFTLPIGMTILTSVYRERFPAAKDGLAE
jgi:hypothetical protein